MMGPVSLTVPGVKIFPLMQEATPKSFQAESLLRGHVVSTHTTYLSSGEIILVSLWVNEERRLARFLRIRSHHLR